MILRKDYAYPFYLSQETYTAPSIHWKKIFKINHDMW